MDKHYTVDPETFFAALNSFDANIAISGNFVLNTKNSNVCKNNINLRRAQTPW